MSDALPAPLTPADCDLQDFQFMPLDVARLRDSDLAAMEEPEACWAAVLLWCASWHQVPAASLTDDDRLLSKIAGYQRAPKEWKRIRAGALRGWVKCSDGRLYHPVVAEKARESWQAKLVHHWERACARIRKWNQRHEDKIAVPSFDAWMAAGRPDAAQMSHGTGEDVPEDIPPTSLGTGPTCPTAVPRENALKGQGEGQEESKQAARDLRLVAGPVRWDDVAIKPAGIDPRKPPDHPDNIRDRDRPCVNGFYLDWTFEQAMEAAGIDPARSTATWKPVVEWLKAGIDPATIKAAIRRCAERSAYRPPTSLAWFDGAVREQRAAA